MAAGETLGRGRGRAEVGRDGGGFLRRQRGRWDLLSWECSVARGCSPAVGRESGAGRWQGLGLSAGASWWLSGPGAGC